MAAVAGLAVCIVLAGAESVAWATRVRKVSVEQLNEWRREEGQLILIDVRAGGTPDRIPGAIHVPLSRLDEWASTADKDSRIVVYCD